jgi:hypothetical protein
MRSLVINATHIIDNFRNNRFRFRFANPINFREGDQIALAGLQMYYSVYNITAEYGNNVIQYRWVDGTEHTILITDGFYSIPELNAYCQRAQASNGHYLLSEESQVYYLSMEINQTYYSIQLNEFALPTSAQATTAGLTRPDGVSWSLPSNARTPQWIIPSSSKIRDIVGFNAGVYPTTPQTSDQQQLSQYTPQVHPVQSYIVHVNTLKNNIGIPSTILYTFSPEVSFGGIISVKPSEFAFIDLLSGNFAEIEVFITDQLFNPVRILDPQMVIFLMIRNADET